MMEKLAQAGEGGGCTSTLFHSLYHHVQSCGVVYILSSWEGRYTPPISTLPLCGSELAWWIYMCMQVEMYGGKIWDFDTRGGLILQEFWYISKYITLTVLFSGFENFWCFHFPRFMLSTVNESMCHKMQFQDSVSVSPIWVVWLS